MARKASINLRRLWEIRIKDQRESKKTVRRWCKDNELSHATFFYWKNKLKVCSVSKKQDFVEIQDMPQESSCSGIQIKHNDFVLCLQKDFDRATFKDCLQALKELYAQH